MDAKQRQSALLATLRRAKAPIAGAELAKQLGVSRQIIVQDIAALRSDGREILSGKHGYTLVKEPGATRVFKVAHTDDEVKEELSMLVDLGGWVRDIFVFHKAYGVLRAELHIQSHADIDRFLKEIHSGKSSLLKNVTAGYHYHTVWAKDEETLERIRQALDKRGFLAPLQDYEPEDLR